MQSTVSIGYCFLFLHTEGLTFKLARSPGPWLVVCPIWMHNNYSCMHKLGIRAWKLDTQLFTEQKSFSLVCPWKTQGLHLLSRKSSATNIKQFLGSIFSRLIRYNIIPSRDCKVGTLCWPELKFHTHFTALADCLGLKVPGETFWGSWEGKRFAGILFDVCKSGQK